MAKKKEDVVINDTPTTRRVKKERKVIDLKMEVPVRSVFDGTVGYTNGRTGTIEWESYGDEQWMKVEELVAMKSSKPIFFTKPWLIIDDEEVSEYLKLTEIYNSVLDVENLEHLYDLSLTEIVNKLKVLPKGFKETIIGKTQKMIEDGSLYNMKIIKAIEKELDFQFDI